MRDVERASRPSHPQPGQLGARLDLRSPIATLNNHLEFNLKISQATKSKLTEDRLAGMGDSWQVKMEKKNPLEESRVEMRRRDVKTQQATKGSNIDGENTGCEG